MRVSGLFVYPVKSCAGVALSRCELDRYGLRHDRSFVVVDSAGRFLSQRTAPELALVRTLLRGAELILDCPTVGTATVPLDLSRGGPARGARTVEVSVWAHQGAALDAGDEAADLLSEHLGIRCRLAGLAPEHDRTAGLGHTVEAAAVSFSDAYPLLVTTEASLDELNDRLPRPIGMDRFRPNVVIAGSEPFAEDHWGRIAIGDVEIDLVKPCSRCVTTTVDQATGKRTGPEPLRTLAAFRRAPSGGVTFGQNAVHRTRGSLEVGRAVTVLTTRTEPRARADAGDSRRG